MNTVQNFLDQLRARPKVAEAIDRDPAFRSHVAAIEGCLNAVHELGNDHGLWLERYDEISELLGREDLTLKERLIELGRIHEIWYAAIKKKKN